MSSEIPSQRGDKFRITFAPESFEVLQDLTMERVGLSLKQHNPPSDADIRILGWKRSEPYMIVPELSELGALAERFIDYAEDSSRMATNIEMELTAVEALPLVNERLAKAEVAKRAAAKILDQLDYQALIGPKLEVPQDWLS